MSNYTNILYVFNPILLISVFAAELRLSNSTILISKNYSIVVLFFFITEDVCLFFLQSEALGVKGLLDLPKI